MVREFADFLAEFSKVLIRGREELRHKLMSLQVKLERNSEDTKKTTIPRCQTKIKD